MVMDQMIQFMKQMSGKLNSNVYTSLPSQSDPSKIAYIRNLQRELKNKDTLQVPFDELEVVVFDIETTGFFPYKGDKILSIGAVKMQGERVLEDDVFYAPIYSEEAPPEEIEKLTGITKEQLINAEPMGAVLKDFYQFIKSDTLVAHHSSHEKQFMKHATWSVLKTNFQHRIIDTAFLTKIIDPVSNLITLDECCDHYGISIERRHHALYDSIATAKLWSKSIRQVKELGFSNLKDVYAHIANLK
ncbi:exonuclease domain-containing protein [Aquibacillus kalidii]|uniref:exonuclease domain-containing protein n=1 Tax=Aquibacillus kalidii TaxID=2762597 RepID=UPI001647063A|nr:exonuclease domain-containing protein [Aquibacillus kalidii]